MFLDSWLPVTHKPYFEKYQGKFEILGQVFDSARIGIDGKNYGELHITEYQSSIVGLAGKLTELESLDELNLSLIHI